MTVLPQWLRNLTSPGALQARSARKSQLAYQEADERFLWITDAGRRIGLIDRKECTLEWIAPHPDQPPARPAEIPTVYHAPTYQGGRIIAQWWLTPQNGVRFLPGCPWRRPWDAPPARGTDNLRKHKPKCTWTFGPEQGATLTFRIDEVFENLPGTPRGCHRFTVRYEPLADSYVAEVEAELTLTGDYVIEFCNFYAGGTYDNRPGRKRYQQTIWSHPDGRLVRWPHNPASYLTPGMNDPEGERRIATGGFIGYFTDPFSNPVLELEESTLPVTGATCCNIYDEHLLLLSPAEPAATEHYRARFRLYSMLPEVAREIVAHSELIRFGVDPAHPNPLMTSAEAEGRDLSRRLNYHPQYPAFYQGCVNGFETPIPLDQTDTGILIFASSNPEHEVYWDDQCGHRGHRSIRLRGRGPGMKTGTRLEGGPTPHLDGNCAYRLSGWIRGEGVTGGAQIRFDEIGFRPSERTAPSHLAGPLQGTADWTYFECLFTTLPETQFGWLYLDLEGAGQAWFDDVALELAVVPANSQAGIRTGRP